MQLKLLDLRIALLLAVFSFGAYPDAFGGENNTCADEGFLASPVIACPFMVDIDVSAVCTGSPPNSGSLEITATMGTEPYEYSINGVNFFPGNTFSNLTTGPVTVTVRDADGCEVVTMVNIPSGIPPEVVVFSIDSASCGLINGKIDVGPGGGVPPFAYSLNAGPQQPEGTFPTGPGMHTVFIEDANGCVGSLTVEVKDAGFPEFDTLAATVEHCHNADGTIYIEVSGGVIPYLYSIDGGPYQNANFFLDVEAGVYDIDVVDFEGCELTGGTVTVDHVDGPMLGEPFAINSLCGASTGLIFAGSVGGTDTIWYSLDDGPQQLFPNWHGVAGGWHTISVIDSNGCTDEVDVEVPVIGGPTIVDFQVVFTTCGQDDGSITVFAETEFGTLQYKIDNEDFSTNNVFTNLSAGDYDITVRDDSECFEEITVTVISSEGPTIDAIEIDAHCGEDNGSAFLFAYNGVEPFLFSFDGGPFGEVELYDSLASDFYEICVRDEQGCTTCEEIYIDNDDPPLIDSIVVGHAACGNPGSLQIYSSDGAGNHFYSLDSVNFDHDSLITGLGPGTYTVYLVDAGMCTAQDQAQIVLTTADTVSLIESICNGQTYTVGTSVFNATGNYQVLLENSQGCDSLVQLNLSVNSCCIVQGAAIGVTICEGDSYTFQGEVYTVSGTYADTISNATSAGCDSVAFLNLQVVGLISTSESQEICIGENYIWNGTPFSVAGTYFDTLLSSVGCDSAVRLTLTVNPLPTAQAGADQTLDCETPTVTLTGTGTGTPRWNGPGVVNNPNFQIQTALPGQYILTVTSADGCTATDAVQVFPNPSAPAANAGPDGTISCVLDSAILSGSGVGSNLSYQWFGPGVPPTHVNTAQSLGYEEGIYYLIVTDEVSGCVSAPDTAIITDISVDLVATITSNGNIDCTQETVTLSSTGSSGGPGVTYEWVDPDNQSTFNVQTLIADEPGEYFLYITDNPSGCETVGSYIVLEFIENPPANAGPDRELNCIVEEVTLNANGGSPDPDLTYEWSGPGITTNPDLQSVTVDLPGTYTLTVTDNTNGCSATDALVVADVSVLPIADAGQTQELNCSVTEVELDGGESSVGPEFEHLWNGPETVDVEGLSIEVTLPGWYTLLVTNTDNGCEDIDSVEVTSDNIITGVDVDVINPSCHLDSTGMVIVEEVEGGTPPYVYSINGVIFGQSPVFDELLGGTYTLTIYDDVDCKWEEEIVIEEADSVYIELGPDRHMLINDSEVMDPDIGPPGVRVDSIRWNTTGGWINCTDCLTPTIIVTEEGTFEVSATIYLGDCVLEDSFLVRSNDTIAVFVPNVFSPNDDDINDYFTIYSNDDEAMILDLKIFDRWGDFVFGKQDFLVNIPELGWDGSIKEQQMMPSVFVYQAEVLLRNGEIQKLLGDVTLIR